MPNFNPQALGLTPSYSVLGNPEQGNVEERLEGWTKDNGDGTFESYRPDGTYLGRKAYQSTWDMTKSGFGSLIRTLAPIALTALAGGTAAGAGPLAGLFGTAGAGTGLAGDVLSKAVLDGTTAFGANSIPGAFNLAAYEAALGAGAPTAGSLLGKAALDGTTAFGANSLPGAFDVAAYETALANGASTAAAVDAASTGGTNTVSNLGTHTGTNIITDTGASTAANTGANAAATTGANTVSNTGATTGAITGATTGATKGASTLLDKLGTAAALTGGSALAANVLAPGGTGAPPAGTITDPLALIAAQGKENRDTFQYMLDNSRIGASNPYGTSGWTKDASGRWVNTQELSPESQGIFNQATSGLSNALSALPSNGLDAYNQALADAVYKRSRLYLDPADAQARDALQSNLADRGFQVGNAGYNTEMTRLDDSQARGRADAAYQAQIQGAQEGRAGLTSQQNIINTLSNMRAAQFGGLQGLPSTSATPNLAPTDIVGINQTAANNALDKANAQAYGKNQMFGNLLNFGASIFGAGKTS